MATIDYKEKYEQALERAKYYHDRDNIQFLENIFPELAESEDEKIRKELIEQVVYIVPNDDEVDSEGNVLPTYQKRIDKYLAWLEKQGEKGAIGNEREIPNSEQKSAYKIEPKFKVGDWVIDKQGIVHQIANVIENVTNHTYAYDIVGGGYFNDSVEGVRLWTIQDAKDGDVLFTSSTASYEAFVFKGIDEKGNAKCYFAYDSEDGFREGTYHFIGRATNCKPATKEWRDLLFQKMKAAGYTFDFEKKELKKIEQTSWSEEDDDNMIMIEDRLRDYLDYIMEDSTLSKNQKKSLKEEVIRYVNWLKSLKDRVQPQSQWRPSDEQIEALDDAIAICSERDYETECRLDNLRQDLRKLKG